MILMAMETMCDYCYLQTEYALDNRKHHSYDCELVKKANQRCIYSV